MTTIKMTQTGDNFAEIVREIPTPSTIDEVPATLYAILDAWREFGTILDAEVNKNPRNPIEALGAATAGGALGVLRMVVAPTIENLARAIDERLTADLDAAADAWGDGPVAVDLPTLEVDENAAQIVEDAISGAIRPPADLNTDPAPFDVVTAAQGVARGEYNYAIDKDGRVYDGFTGDLVELDPTPVEVDELDEWAKRVGYVDADPTPAAGTIRPEVEQ